MSRWLEVKKPSSGSGGSFTGGTVPNATDFQALVTMDGNAVINNDLAGGSGQAFQVHAADDATNGPAITVKGGDAGTGTGGDATIQGGGSTGTSDEAGGGIIRGGNGTGTNTAGGRAEMDGGGSTGTANAGRIDLNGGNAGGSGAGGNVSLIPGASVSGVGGSLIFFDGTGLTAAARPTIGHSVAVVSVTDYNNLLDAVKAAGLIK